MHTLIHLILFLDINKFICNVTVPQHYFNEEDSIQRNDISTNECSIDSSVLSFRENCAIIDLEDLKIEQLPMSGCETDGGDTQRVPFCVPSDVYPIQSRSLDMDIYSGDW